jgi:uncharacterized protein (TIGR03437 family)
MMHRLVLTLCVVAACGDGGEGPVIDDVQPPAAAAGATIEIIGDRFCGDEDSSANDDGTCVSPPASLVFFGEQPDASRASISMYSHTQITAVVPAAAAVGATVVIVVRGEVESNRFDFEVQ